MTTPTSRGSSVGRVQGALLKLLTRAATVARSELIEERFRLITLSGSELRGVPWLPGQKVQLQMGGWTQRTYTPMSWDPVAGSTQLLAYVHGDGPGATWARELRVGDSCMVFGPRGSLDLDALSAPGLLFGDETSIGLAHALRFSKSGGRGIALLLEVGDRERTRALLARLGLEAELITKQEEDRHLPELEAAATKLIQAHSLASGVLSGKATTIRQLGKHVRSLGLRKIQTRAYWAPGKKGLD